MKNENFVAVLAKYTLIGSVRNLITWPVWWYSSGLIIVFKGTLKLISQAWHNLSLGVWLINIFRPMYGQYDVASRIISFFMRLIQIIIRSILMLILLAIFIALFFIYLFLPPLTIWMLIYLYIK
ncbi:hypothetical protein KKF32_00325 [Patescibacteria group bacterium]|nr:hypothetical protein [Patescibacteria group bacterium]